MCSYVSSSSFIENTTSFGLQEGEVNDLVNFENVRSDTYIYDLIYNPSSSSFLDQAKNTSRGILDKLKFISIVASNFDEFFEIRVGSLYNYIDNNKTRIDYSGLREKPFRNYLLDQAKVFFEDYNNCYTNEIINSLKS